MKQHCLLFLKGAIKGFTGGALASLSIYLSLRIILHDFKYSLPEEAILFLKTIGIGGALTSLAVVAYLLIEMIIVAIALRTKTMTISLNEEIILSQKPDTKNKAFLQEADVTLYHIAS